MHYYVVVVTIPPLVSCNNCFISLIYVGNGSISTTHTERAMRNFLVHGSIAQTVIHTTCKLPPQKVMYYNLFSVGVQE